MGTMTRGVRGTSTLQVAAVRGVMPCDAAISKMGSSGIVLLRGRSYSCDQLRQLRACFRQRDAAVDQHHRDKASRAGWLPRHIYAAFEALPPGDLKNLDGERRAAVLVRHCGMRSFLQMQRAPQR